MISSSETGAVVRVTRRAYWHSFFYLSYSSSSVETETFSVLKTRGALLRNVFSIYYLMMWWDLCLTRPTHAKRWYIKHESFDTRAAIRRWLCIRQNRMWYPTEFCDGHSVTEEPPAISISASLGCIKFSNTNFLDSGQNDYIVHQLSPTRLTPSSVACSESG